MIKKTKVFVGFKLVHYRCSLNKSLDCLTEEFRNFGEMERDPIYNNERGSQKAHMIFFYNSPDSAEKAIKKYNCVPFNKEIGELTVTYKVDLKDSDDYKVFVDNIPKSATKREILEYFGGIQVIKIELYPSEDNKSNQAVIRFYDNEKAIAAVNDLNGKIFQRNSLRVYLNPSKKFDENENENLIRDYQNYLNFNVPTCMSEINKDEILAKLNDLDYPIYQKHYEWLLLLYFELSKKFTNKSKIFQIMCSANEKYYYDLAGKVDLVTNSRHLKFFLMEFKSF